MKKAVFITAAALGALLILLGACGRSRSPVDHSVVLRSQSARERHRLGSNNQHLLTEEDYMVMAMPLEERITYFRQKYKELVWELHGIAIADDEASGRTVSLDEGDMYHKVWTYDSVNEVPREEFNLVQTAEDPKPK